MDPERARRRLGVVLLSRWNARWPEDFRDERMRLAPVLGAMADDLQHYGSTAVPGLDAKPVIDMMAPVGSLAEADALRPALQAAGYEMIDVGFARRRFFRRAPASRKPAYHLHLVVSPDWPLKSELLFRDWLTEHPEVARDYAALKLQLARQFGGDMPRYTDGKTAFIRHAVNVVRACRGLPPETDWTE